MIPSWQKSGMVTRVTSRLSFWLNLFVKLRKNRRRTGVFSRCYNAQVTADFTHLEFLLNASSLPR